MIIYVDIKNCCIEWWWPSHAVIAALRSPHNSDLSDLDPTTLLLIVGVITPNTTTTTNTGATTGTGTCDRVGSESHNYCYHTYRR